MNRKQEKKDSSVNENIYIKNRDSKMKIHSLNE